MVWVHLFVAGIFEWGWERGPAADRAANDPDGDRIRGLDRDRGGGTFVLGILGLKISSAA